MVPPVLIRIQNTINEKWLNDQCVAPKTDDSTCNDSDVGTTGEVWKNNVCAIVNVVITVIIPVRLMPIVMRTLN